MSRVALALLSVLLVMVSTQLFAGPFETDLRISGDFGTEIMDGFTQYSLIFLFYEEDYYKEYANSRLKFPTTSYLTGGNITLGIMGFEAGFGYWGQFRASKSTPMEDFDWLTSTRGDFLNVAYGSAMPHPDVYYWQAKLGYRFNISKVWLGPFFRYSKYHSEFIITDLDQTWYVNLDDGQEYDPPQQFMVEGQVLYYEQDLKMPVFGVDFGLIAIPEKLELFSSLGFSTIVSVKDYDDHIVRDDSLDAWNDGDGGKALMAGLGGRVNVFNAFWLNLNFAYQEYSVDTDGRQTTWDKKTGEFTTISGLDTHVKGVMRNMRLTLSYMFR